MEIKFQEITRFYFEDLASVAKDKNIKPRRLRSIGGALRRIITGIKNMYKDKNKIFSYLKFYTIEKYTEKLKTIFVAV